MTGRPGDRAMEMNGGSAALYLARVPVFLLVVIGLEAKGFLDFQGRRGITSVVRWNLRPVIFGVDFEAQKTHLLVIFDSLYKKRKKSLLSPFE